MTPPLQPMTPLEPLRPMTPLQPLLPMTPLQPIGSAAGYSPPAPAEQEDWSEPEEVPAPPPVSYQPPPPVRYDLPPPQVTPLPGGIQLPVRVRRRSGGAAAAIIGVVAALIVGLAALGSHTSSGGGPVVVSVPSISLPTFGSTNGSGSSAGSGLSGHHSGNAVASIGQSRVLSGNVNGQRVRVTLLSWRNTARSKDSFFGPRAGKRFVAAKFRIRNVGSAFYVDSPANGAYVFDRAGRRYRTTFAVSGIREGPVFDAVVSLAAGESARGFLVFEVPRHASIRRIRFSENSGFGQAGTWSIRR
jgi:hypothetical protein